MRSRVITGVMGALLASVLLSGCAAAGSPDTNADFATDGQSLSAVGNTIFECLTERGWDIDLTWDGNVEASSENIPSGQEDRYFADELECREQIDARISAMDSSQIAEVYAQELATRDCLLDMGYEVAEPPSEQAYIDSFQTNRWAAYFASNLNLGQLPDEEWREVAQTCPQPAWSLGA